MNKTQYVFRLILFASLCFFYGCSTVMTQGPYTERRYTKTSDIPSTSETLPNIYSGVAADYYMFKVTLNSESGGDIVGKTQAVFFVGIYTILDLPFSFVADTILLPYTIYKQYVYGNIYNCKLATKCSEVDDREKAKSHKR